MKFVFKKISIKRLKYLINSSKKMSVTRALQYEIIKNIKLNGKVLDYGGGREATYLNILNVSNYSSINISHKLKPTYKIRVGDKIPVKSLSFDNLISFNTLEHIFDPKLVINEMHRVLKKKGKILITTPFLFPIHGAPDDFFRPTPSWYSEILKKRGFVDIKIIPLSWGPFLLSSSVSGSIGPFKRPRLIADLILDYFYYLLKKNSYFNFAKNRALGYFIIAKKK